MADKQAHKTSDTVQCLIGNGIEFRGDLTFHSGLHVDGHVIGNIQSKPGVPARLTLSKDGVIDGNVTTSDAEINGTINGDVHASGSVIMHPNSHVSGNVYYEAIEIRRGACINGKLITTHEHEDSSSSLIDKFTRKSA